MSAGSSTCQMFVTYQSDDKLMHKFAHSAPLLYPVLGAFSIARYEGLT